MERSLNDIALDTGTDKSDRRHGYTWLYEAYLAARRPEPITLLEIGVWEGQSLRMWREYFPNARVYGLDCDPRCRQLSLPGIELFIGDQSNAEHLADIARRAGPLDVVIDDGSHVGEHQIASFEALFPALREGGLYVVEDLHTSYWGWGERSSILYFKGLVDAVMLQGRSRWADIRNDANYLRLRSQLGYFEEHVESVHFHRSIVFIRKGCCGERSRTRPPAEVRQIEPQLVQPDGEPVTGEIVSERCAVGCAAGPFKVVIPSASAVNLIPCVRALMENEPDLQPEDVLVVDDGARREAESSLPRVRWLTGPKPFVFSRNVNLGIREAATEVILLNDDARLRTPRGLTQLVRGMKERGWVGVCSPGISGVVANPNQRPTGRSEWREEARMLAFVCAYIPKRVYDVVGPFDERFTGYGFDDNDYCARVLAAGLRLVIWDGCVVDHGGELPSSFRTRPDIEALFSLNQRRFEAKWGGSR